LTFVPVHSDKEGIDVALRMGKLNALTGQSLVASHGWFMQ
jgi:hypothetical protein